MGTSSNRDVAAALSGRRVLVVDDEELMREVTAMMIEDVGGVSSAAANATEALSIFQSNQTAFDCVVLDFSMPGMDGYELLTALRAIRPTLPAVMMSGLGCTREVGALASAGEVTFVSKPFQQAQLVLAIQAQLARG